ncbi:MAG: methyltransferase domain-containing protein [Eubacteriales bacterium]|nr:methyltransferase domain-containing protein [Eubacteriales bacterium]
MQASKTKKEYAARLLMQQQAAFACPICRQGMAADAGGLTCLRGHRFDLSKAGTICLLRDYGRHLAAGYDAQLFDSRRWVFAHGYFDALIQAVMRWLPQDGLALDLGCGEGSPAAAWAAGRPALRIAGVDISATGIKKAASAARENTCFIQGDLAALPFADGCADAVLNILSPARYREFARVMKRGALLIKAAPTPRHLRQIRRALDKTYADEADVRARFCQAFALVDETRLEYTLPVADAEAAQHLMRMTPLAENAPSEMTFSDKDITFSMNIYIGRAVG